MCQSHSDLTGRLSLTIAGLDLDATKVVSSHPISVSVAGTPGPAGPESHQISWTVLRHCLYDRYAALPRISSDTLGIGSDLPSAREKTADFYNPQRLHERTPHECCLLRWHRRDCSPCHGFRRQSNGLKAASRKLIIGSSVSADSVDRATAATSRRRS